MSVRPLVLLTGLLLAWGASAHDFVVGQPVPVVSVMNRGELLIEQGNAVYQPWSSVRLGGKVRVLLHLAGRMAAKKENAPLTDALQAAHLPREGYQTTLIVNTDDAIPGSAMFVRASLQSSKAESPWSQFIVDDDGAAAKAWHLRKEGSAVVVLDRQGHVQFAKDGALTPAEIRHVTDLLHRLLQ
ncbi:YtfJ family protein [Rouxiella chamberiensis]|uniref:YtfJ family protein n=1 Tax=Rouxiella chamberiensis TaxID=1513468 RepID=UPI0005D332EF|nr:YtfJ family protein [Rouxiella chamberiensis]